MEKTGKLTYRRQIPTELRPLLGGKAEIKRTLRTTSTDAGSASVLTAYSEVHSEVEALIQEARTRLEGLSTLMRVDSSFIRPNQEHFSLSKREIAGIAGQVWLDIRNMVVILTLISFVLYKFSKKKKIILAQDLKCLPNQLAGKTPQTSKHDLHIALELLTSAFSA